MSFIAWNKSVCARLRERHPSWFRGESPHWRMCQEIDAALSALRAEGRHPVVLEVGGVDRPMLPRDAAYRLIGLDVDHRPAADTLYDAFIHGSVANPIPIRADLILSYALLEHLPDSGLALTRMREALTEGGRMIHYHPCKNHPYAWLLRLVGTRMQRWLIDRFRPEAAHVTGYAVHFDGCTVAARRRMGFEVTPFYRANEYFDAFVPAYVLMSVFETLCQRMGWTFFAAGVLMTGRGMDA